MSYIDISNFTNDTLKTALKDDILNPLITQHNEHSAHLAVVDADVLAMGESIVAVETSVGDHETRLASLELGGGGDVDLSPIITRLDTVEESLLVEVDRVDTVSADLLVASEKVTVVEETLVTVTERIDVLESSGSSPAEPTKWYVLPLGGQSNMQGWGERDMPLENNPRLKQLATFNSNPTTSEWENVSKAASAYGDRYKEFRPVEETNMTLIPATPCLDSAKNKFHQLHSQGNKDGGMVSPGLYIAKAILPYIPEDYGIIIVDCSKGSSGFGDMHTAGTYDAAAKRCSMEGSKWGVNTPMGNMFMDRIKHCLGLNPENRLLPVIWLQGENDVNVQQHFDRAKAYFIHMRDALFAAYPSAFPKELACNFRILCFGTARKMLTYPDDNHATCGRSIHDWDINYETTEGAGDDPWGIHDHTNSRSNFDNYSFFMDDPDFRTGYNNEPEVIMARTDIDCFGNFNETGMEEGLDQGGYQIGYSADWHYSTNFITNAFPSKIMNIIGTYTNYLYNPFPTGKLWTREVRGKMGVVATDDVRYVFDRGVSKVRHLPTIYQNFPAAASTLVGYTEDSSVETVASTDFPGISQVGGFSSTTQYASYTAAADKDTSFTISFMFQDTSGDAENTSLLLTGTSGKPFLNIVHKNGSWIFHPLYDHADKAGTIIPNFMIHKALHGGWEGMRGDWQQVSLVYDKTLSVMHFYFNGCLVESLHDISGIILSDIHLGKSPSDNTKFFKGNISSFSLFEEVLSKEEVNYLYQVAKKGVALDLDSVSAKVNRLSRWHLEL